MTRALGPRIPEASLARKEAHAVFALLTSPGEAVTSTAVAETARRIDDLRSSFEEDWSRFTRGQGTLCTTITPCEGGGEPDAGVNETPPSGRACDCSSAADHPRPWRTASALVVVVLSAVFARLTRMAS